jgi:hypothetical protein
MVAVSTAVVFGLAGKMQREGFKYLCSLAIRVYTYLFILIEKLVSMFGAWPLLQRSVTSDKENCHDKYQASPFISF